METKYISVQDAARLLPGGEVTPQHIRHLCKTGKLPGARKLGEEDNAQWIIPLASVQQYQAPVRTGRPRVGKRKTHSLNDQEKGREL